MGARPSISQCGATLQMFDWLFSLSTSSDEVQSRPGSEAKHRANSECMAPWISLPSERMWAQIPWILPYITGTNRFKKISHFHKRYSNKPFCVFILEVRNQTESWGHTSVISLTLRLEGKQEVAPIYSEVFKTSSRQRPTKHLPPLLPQNKHTEPIQDEFRGLVQLQHQDPDIQSKSVVNALSWSSTWWKKKDSNLDHTSKT